MTKIKSIVVIWGEVPPPGSNSGKKNKLKLNKSKSFEPNEVIFGTLVDDYVKKQSVEFLHDQTKLGWSKISEFMFFSNFLGLFLFIIIKM